MRPVWAAIPLLLLLLLLQSRAGSGLPAPADRSPGWPDLWGVLRAIRDTSAVVQAKTKGDSVTSLETKPAKTDKMDEQSASAVVSDTKQASNKSLEVSLMSSALERVRSLSRWGKAMATSVAGTVSSVGSTVNTAVGTVLQVINGGKQQDDDKDHVCFSDLGCFSLREPWISSKRPLPRMNPPESIQTKFFLHTRNSSEPHLLDVSDGEDEPDDDAMLLPGLRTFFLVHGFNDKSTSTWVQDMKDALLEKMECNVILVDWSLGAQASKNYLQAASNARVVGAELSRVAELLSRRSLVDLDQMHAVGHSLGAHVAGYAGKQLSGKLGRITALDAAQPAFEDQDAEVRVAAGDALFVDVVHTNGAPFIPTLGLGVMHPVGDVDFYLNGGTVQPGCFVPKLPAVNSLGDLAALPVSVLGDMLSCSHRRAIEYFTEAIRSDCRMWGKRRVEDDLADKDDVVAAESSGAHSSPWWHPLPSPGFGGLLANVFSGDSTTETPVTTVPPVLATPSSSRGFPFNLLSVFSGGGNTKATREAQSGSKNYPFSFLTSMFSPGETRTKKRSAPKPSGTKLIVKDPEGQVTVVESNDIADTTEGDYSTSTPATTVETLLPPSPPWCDDDCVPLGLDTEKFGLKGTFNIDTADHAPYCIPEVKAL